MPVNRSCIWTKENKTFYFFSKFFHLKNFPQFYLKTTEMNAKLVGFFWLIFYILTLFRNFEIGRKIVKNGGLTPLLFFPKFFHLKNFPQFYLKMTEMNAKLVSFG